MHQYGWCSIAFPGSLFLPIGKPQILALKICRCTHLLGEIQTSPKENEETWQERCRATWKENASTPSVLEHSSQRKGRHPYSNTDLLTAGVSAVGVTSTSGGDAVSHHSPRCWSHCIWESLLFPWEEAEIVPMRLFLIVGAVQLFPGWHRGAALLVFSWDGTHSLLRHLTCTQPGGDPGPPLPCLPFSLQLGFISVSPYLKLKEEW